MINWLTEFVRGIVDGASPPSVDVQDGQRRVQLVREGYRVVEVLEQDETRDHMLGDLPSVLHYLKRHGKPDASTLFCDPQKFVAVLDDNGATHGPGQVHYRPLLTEAAQAWLRICRTPLGHAKLKEAIEDRAMDLRDKALFEAVLKFSVRSEVSYDADLESGDEVVFKIATKQGGPKGAAKLPKQFQIEIQPFRGWDRTYVFSFRINFDLDADKRPVFTVSARDWAEVQDLAIDDMIDWAIESLGEGWLVVRGAPCLTEMRLPANHTRS